MLSSKRRGDKGEALLLPPALDSGEEGNKQTNFVRSLALIVFESNLYFPMLCEQCCLAR